MKNIVTDHAKRQQAPEPGSPIVSERCVCPECGHVFKGNGWDGIDAHWKAKHGKVMPYDEAWPLIRSRAYGQPMPLAEAIETQEANKAGVDAKNAMDRRKATPESFDGLSQSEKFAQAARDLGKDESEDAFKDVLRKLGGAKAAAMIKTKKQRGQSKSDD